MTLMGSPAAVEAADVVEDNGDDIEIKCATVARPKALQERIDMRRKRRENAKRGPIKMDLGIDDGGDDSLDDDDAVGEVPAPTKAVARTPSASAEELAADDCTLSIDDSAAKPKSSSSSAAAVSAPPAAAAAPPVLDLVDDSLPTVSRRRSSGGSLVEVVDEQPPAKVARKAAKSGSREQSKGLVVLE
mmetsp:Transcript_9233/g.16627  ORF Transcript_9233/g.16627 Transcript_9233/m.16627 type:complete len:188 (-) Transcript_9233:61-624(-)